MRRVFRPYKEFDPLPPYFQKRKQGKREGAESLFGSRGDFAASLHDENGQTPLGGEGEGSTHPKHSSPRCALPITYSRLPIPFPTLEPLFA